MTCSLSLLAEGGPRPIPVSEFCAHFEKLRAGRDKLLEKEYTVNRNTHAQ